MSNYVINLCPVHVNNCKISHQAFLPFTLSQIFIATFQNVEPSSQFLFLLFMQSPTFLNLCFIKTVTIKMDYTASAFSVDILPQARHVKPSGLDNDLNLNLSVHSART